MQTEWVLVTVAVAVGAFVQGLTGLGFALVAAPVVSQVVPGTSGIGLVNALSIVQNGWLVARTDAAIAWRVVARMVPGLAAGVLLGWIVLRTTGPAVFPVIVAASACASVAWLLLADRFRGAVAGVISAVWGGLVNTVAGVGGPPIAAYLVTRGLPFGEYLRTLQVVFALLSVVSLPLLGVSFPSLGWLAAWLVALVVGSVAGELLRARFDESLTQRVGKSAIVVVCVAALIRSVAALVFGA
ncbi:MAG: TSUP family transporter [Actinomycetota bacterium]|nr:TSUP family transporter [Actinomycetota bacterium]